MRNERSDADVIREILEGNVNAFELLMDRYQGYVAGIVIKKVPKDRTQEVAHEAFIRAYRSLDTFKAKTPFKHWLASIAVRCCHDFWRQHYRRKETPISSISDDGWEWIRTLQVDGSAEAPDGYARNPEALRVLRWAMEGMSPEDRMVLTLVHMGGVHDRRGGGALALERSQGQNTCLSGPQEASKNPFRCPSGHLGGRGMEKKTQQIERIEKALAQAHREQTAPDLPLNGARA